MQRAEAEANALRCMLLSDTFHTDKRPCIHYSLLDAAGRQSENGKVHKIDSNSTSIPNIEDEEMHMINFLSTHRVASRLVIGRSGGCEVATEVAGESTKSGTP